MFYTFYVFVSHLILSHSVEYTKPCAGHQVDAFDTCQKWRVPRCDYRSGGIITIIFGSLDC